MQHPLYQKAEYLKSVPTLDLCPEEIVYEVAFAGRSNAGKSSALNVITSQKSLARTSKTPGRTQLINFFPVDETRALVDLPGYGFAKVNINTKRAWEAGLSEYVEKREQLKGLILLMDCRIPPTEIDLQMLDWTAEIGLPVHVLLTKADKLKKGPAKAQLMQLKKMLKAEYPHASAQLFSSLKKDGLDQVWQQLDTWMEYERPVKEKTEDSGKAKKPAPKKKPKTKGNIRRFN
ncbi:ribosome biogenesis GTP-binding protein YihA/YsxC [Thiomicrorhabdus sediminis]|uniref:Probable GTP-binding protein EngB n=1 Tax=Thiomicrorhabdus sediminis TaxID=2580412 RepID=A0A4P9K2V3_9GAMM|nr:ribosome biogenesis GTP-binding protein YihA/YsxC [Thiomicrorhabdus sediminis]QCU89148.1 YihA family ribosome biogenesis GTP-binding protein [Thiomicrorhabdus sediminis]